MPKRLNDEEKKTSAEKHKAVCSEYRSLHKEKFAEYTRDYYNRNKNDEEFKKKRSAGVMRCYYKKQAQKREIDAKNKQNAAALLIAAATFDTSAEKNETNVTEDVVNS